MKLIDFIFSRYLYLKEPSMTCMEKLYSLFGFKHKPKFVVKELVFKDLYARKDLGMDENYVVKDYSVPKPEPTEFEKVKLSFNPATDMIVISEKLYFSLPADDMKWCDKQGNKVLFFDGDRLINVAIVRER